MGFLEWSVDWYLSLDLVITEIVRIFEDKFLKNETE